MSKSKVIRKEDLSAFQRWEIGSLDEPDGHDATVTDVEDVSIPALPTAEEIERIHEQARQEGYAAGQKEGYQAGYQAGYQETAAQAVRLADVLMDVEQSLSGLIEQIQGQVLSLTLSLSRQILRQALQVKPELILAIVQDALASLPPDSRQPRLFLHPEDAALVQEHLGEQLRPDGWRIVEDHQMSRGGCRLETADSLLDARIESRWSRLMAVFEREDSWTQQ